MCDKVVIMINWQCAHRRCAPLGGGGGLKACPLGTFEILDAFFCNLVHIFFVLSHLSLFYLYSVDERGACAPHAPLDPRLLTNRLFGPWLGEGELT